MSYGGYDTSILSPETFSIKFRIAVPFNVSRKATQTELKEKLHTIISEKRNLEKTVVTIRMQQRDVLSWEEMLHSSCKHVYQEILIVDLLALFREDIDMNQSGCEPLNLEKRVFGGT